MPPTINITRQAIWIAHACSGSGVGELAIQLALQKLWTNNIQLAFIGGLSYEIDEDALRLHAIITNDCPIKLTPRGNIKQWPQNTQLAPNEPNILKLLVAGTPCEQISRGALDTQYKKKIGLHAEPSNIIWLWHEGVVNILRKYQHTDVAVFSEQVVPYDDKIITQLSNILGNQRRVECSQWGGATRTRDFYLIPEINISPIPTKAARTYNLRDGWRWPIPKLQHLMTPPPTLRAIYPELLR